MSGALHVIHHTHPPLGGSCQECPFLEKFSLPQTVVYGPTQDSYHQEYCKHNFATKNNYGNSIVHTKITSGMTISSKKYYIYCTTPVKNYVKVQMTNSSIKLFPIPVIFCIPCCHHHPQYRNITISGIVHTHILFQNTTLISVIVTFSPGCCTKTVINFSLSSFFL